jgi:neopullulanase
MSDEFFTPNWVQHAIFYQIFPDRFAAAQQPQIPKPNNLEAWDSAPTVYGFKGGDLIGVLERFDYLQDLGITAIYFTPVFQSASNHRYHTHDYFQVDPILGGNVALRRLLDEAHRRGIRIVLDGVFNHSSRGFFQFNHVLECGPQSPYVDWFDIRGYPLNAYQGKPNYRCWWDLPALPEFNHQNPQVRRFIFDVARYWIEQGIDGWRLDVPFCIDDDSFWQEFRQTVKRANPQAYITGEIPWDSSRWLQGDQFDGVMNYLFTYACWSFFGGEGMDRNLVGHWYQHGPEYFSPQAADFAASLEKLLTLYPRPAVLAQLNLLDSHDTARFNSIVGGDRRLLRMATLVQMTYPGAPCVYYGNEIGLEGGQDPDCRRSFPWDEACWDLDLRNEFQRLIALRKQYAALRSGGFRTLHAADGVVAYLRELATEQFIITLNHTPQTLHLDLPVSGLADGGLRGLLHGGTARLQGGRLLDGVLAPETGEIWAVDVA